MAISQFKVTPLIKGDIQSGITTAKAIGFDASNRVIFWSPSGNWIAGDTNGAGDFFVRDLGSGEVTRISTSATGAQTNSGADGGVLSPDHSRILFYSDSSLTAVDNGYRDLFVKTIATGEVRRVTTAGDIPLPEGKFDPPPNYTSYLGPYAISPDNSKVAFYGSFPAQAGQSTGVWDLFVRDLNTGVLTRVGLGQVDNPQFNFSSDSTKIIYRSGSGADMDLVARDITTGVVTEISSDATGVSGNGISGLLSVAADKVAFYSNALNLTPGDTANTYDLFVKTLSTGAIQRIVTDPEGKVIPNAVLSPDGSKLIFTSKAALVAGDVNGGGDLFLKDLATGVVTRLSPDVPTSSSDQLVASISLTPDGSKVAFALLNSNSGNTTDIFVADLNSHGVVKAASVNTPIYDLSISPDGDQVVFRSGYAPNSNLPQPKSDSFLIDLTKPGNIPPVAPPTEVWITGDTQGSLHATDGDNDPLNYSLVQGVVYGQLKLNADGTYQYKPPAGFVGDEFFKFRVSDGQSGVDTTLSFHILAPGTPIPTPTTGQRSNTAPVADPLNFDRPEDSVISWAFSARDAQSDAVTYRIVQGPQHGTLTLGPKVWDFKYTPDANFNGDDSFTYEAIDSYGAEGVPAKVSIHLSSVNDAPVALPGVISTTGPVLAAVGGTDVDSANLAFSVTQRPAHGDLTFNADGTFTYIAAPGFVGSDYFVFAVSDGALSSTSTMTLRVFGASGETIVGGSGDDTLRGGWGGDTLTGLGGNDTLIGDRGNDTLDGGKGDDIMIGGLGDDVFYVDSRADQVRENAGEGIDEIRTGLSLTLPDNVENLTLLYGDSIWGTGNALANRIVGNAGANVLKGGGGTDLLIGGDGNDILIGQSGADTLTGGAGADTFQFDSVGDIGFGVETIVDLSSADGDKIDLRGIDANLSLAGDQAFVLIGDALFHKVAGELRATVLGTGYVIQGDVNGDGNADFSLLINVLPTVTDFLL